MPQGNDEESRKQGAASVDRTANRNVRPVVDMGVYGRILVDNLHEMHLPTEKPGVFLTIYQTKTAQTLGSWVYDAAACMAQYMLTEHFNTNFCPGGLKGKTLVELGAGTGIVGIVAAQHGSDVIITDLVPLVPLLQFNIDQNSALLKGRAEAKPLVWGSDQMNDFQPPDILVLANCVYNECILDELLETSLKLCRHDTLLMAAYEERTRGIKQLIKRWHEMIGKHFDITDVPKSVLPTEYFTDYNRIVAMRRKTPNE